MRVQHGGLGGGALAGLAASLVVAAGAQAATYGPPETIGSGSSSSYGVAAGTFHSWVVQFPANGSSKTTNGSGFTEPFEVAVDPAGDVFVAGSSESGVVELPLEQDQTSTRVSCGPAAAAATAQTCVASVSDQTSSSGTPSGSVRLSSNGGGSFSDNASCTLSGGSCSVRYTPATAGHGSRTITASYQGDAGFAASQSTGTAKITARTSTTTVTCVKETAAQRANIAKGKTVSVSCVAIAHRPAGPKPAPLKPTGTVSFSASPSTDAGEDFSPATCRLVLRGTTEGCAVKFATAAAARFAITAHYNSDQYYVASAGQTTLTIR